MEVHYWSESGGRAGTDRRRTVAADAAAQKSIKRDSVYVMEERDRTTVDDDVDDYKTS